MTQLHVIVCALLLSSVVVAQAPPGEVAEQVPVREAVEAVDSPSADEAKGNAEANMPSVEAAPSSDVEAPPPAEPRPDLEQPAVEP